VNSLAQGGSFHINGPNEVEGPRGATTNSAPYTRLITKSALALHCVLENDMQRTLQTVPV